MTVQTDDVTLRVKIDLSDVDKKGRSGGGDAGAFGTLFNIAWIFTLVLAECALLFYSPGFDEYEQPGFPDLCDGKC